jgi:hypothetical protein
MMRIFDPLHAKSNQCGLAILSRPQQETDL